MGPDGTLAAFMARTSRILLALLAILLTAGLSACGGGGSDQSATELIKQTFGGEHPVKSGKLDVRLRFDAKGLQGANGPIALKLTGPFASSGKGKLPRFDFDLALTTGGSTMQLGAVSMGDRGFLKFGGTSYVVSDQLFKQFKDGYEKSAQDSAKKNAAPSFASLGIHPRTGCATRRRRGRRRSAAPTPTTSPPRWTCPASSPTSAPCSARPARSARGRSPRR